MEASDFLSRVEDLDLQIHGVRLPNIELEEEDYKRAGVEKGVDNYEFLKALCRQGYKDKVKAGVIEHSQEYGDRAKSELSIIKELGFVDYILLVFDVINFCSKKGIPVGRGRGSAAGSLILYLIGVTGIDPIHYGLFFERFISKARAKSKVVDGVLYIDGDLAPDVDLDIAHDRRDEVIAYLDKKYKNRFAKLPTFSTLQSKILIKECGKIINGFDEEKMKHISALIPSLFGKVFDLEKACKESEKFELFCKGNPATYHTARKLRKLIKNKSTHASAFLVSHDPLDTFIPCELDVNGDVTCSPDMQYAQMQSIKLDLLGLKCLTLIDNVCKRVGIKPDDIDVEDVENIYAHLQELEAPYGLFQISGDCNVRVTNQIKPKNLNDLAAVVALARPGALAAVDDYAGGGQLATIDDPIIHDVLSDANGCLIYQEHVLAIANRVYGFSKEEGELLRRGIGKKKAAEVAKWEEKLYAAGEEKGIPKETTDWFWKTVEACADYSFNKSHAFSYATLSAQTVYLKNKYPQEFFIECLSIAQGKQDPLTEISLIQEELRHFGIQLLPPDIVKSEMEFTVEGKDIRFGISAIKGVASKSINNIKDFINSDSTNKFQVFQAAKNAGVGLGVLSPLIQAGALSSMGENRPLLVLEGQLWSLLTEKERQYAVEKGGEYDWNLLKMVKNIFEWKDDNGKRVARSTRLNTIKKNYDKYKQIYLANSKSPRFAAYVYERRLLGYSYSQRLNKVFQTSGRPLQSVEDIKNLDEGANVKLIAEVTESDGPNTSAKGWRYVRFSLTDDTGTIKGMMGGNELIQYSDNHPIPKEDSFVVVEAQVGEDLIWIKKISIQDYRVYLKLHELSRDGKKLKSDKEKA